MAELEGAEVAYLDEREAGCVPTLPAAGLASLPSQIWPAQVRSRPAGGPLALWRSLWGQLHVGRGGAGRGGAGQGGTGRVHRFARRRQAGLWLALPNVSGWACRKSPA